LTTTKHPSLENMERLLSLGCAVIRPNKALSIECMTDVCVCVCACVCACVSLLFAMARRRCVPRPHVVVQAFAPFVAFKNRARKKRRVREQTKMYRTLAWTRFRIAWWMSGCPRCHFVDPLCPPQLQQLPELQWPAT
jgi:hypothetical protein